MKGIEPGDPQEAARIREVRRELGLTQREFAQRLGLSRKAILRVENEQGSITPQMRAGISHAFGINEQWLRDGTGSKTLLGNDAISKLGEQYDLNPGMVELIRRIVALPREQQDNIISMLDSIVSVAKSYSEPHEETDLDELDDAALDAAYRKRFGEPSKPESRSSAMGDAGGGDEAREAV